jgi:hypothetical protein
LVPLAPPGDVLFTVVGTNNGNIPLTNVNIVIDPPPPPQPGAEVPAVAMTSAYTLGEEHTPGSYGLVALASSATAAMALVNTAMGDGDRPGSYSYGQALAAAGAALPAAETPVNSWTCTTPSLAVNQSLTCTFIRELRTQEEFEAVLFGTNYTAAANSTETPAPEVIVNVVESVQEPGLELVMVNCTTPAQGR